MATGSSRAALITPVLDRLRPHPHRGDIIAAGAVPLALAAFVIELRMTQWALGPRFVVVFLIAALLLTMGWLAPLEGDSPRAYHSVLLIAGLLPMALALVLLAELIGADRPPGSGGESWVFAVEAGLATLLARHARSAVCTLIAALAAIVAVEEFVTWVFQPHGADTFRAILVVLTLAFAAGAVRLRDRERAHSVQLVNAGGIASLLLGLDLITGLVLAGVMRASGALLAFTGTPHVGFGWKLFLLGVGFGLIAYAGVDRERGPAFIGVAVLGVFALLTGFPTSGSGSLVGWPLFLLAIGAVGLVIGLRPRQPLPPPPQESTATTSETVPLWSDKD
jgi:hypothetical protein